MEELEYKVPSRIAIDLYDMNGNLGRVDGSIGFSIENPCLRFTVRRTINITLRNGEILGDELQAAVEEGLRKIQRLHGFDGISIDFQESIPPHSGLGSKTATLLSTAHAYGLLYEKELDFRAIGVSLNRGGTSGLGINLIDKGGFIVDGGHSIREKKGFLPSSATNGVSAPPVLARYNMPEWDVLLVILDLPRVYGSKEKEFFRRICPVPADDVSRLARVTLSQVMPGVVEGDLGIFCEGINAVQKSVWKSGEICLYGARVKKLIASLRQQGALGVGMSSIGPSVYALGGDLKKIATELDAVYSMVRITRPNNTGLRIVI